LPGIRGDELTLLTVDVLFKSIDELKTLILLIKRAQVDLLARFNVASFVVSTMPEWLRMGKKE